MQTTLNITQSIDSAAFTGLIDPVSTDPNLSVQRLANYLKGMTGGNYTSGISIVMNINAVAATATFTITSTGPANGETFVLNGVTFTARTSGATGNEFNISATPATVAANIVTAVNNSASAAVTNAVTASSALGVVTFTANYPGLMGNGLTISESLANTALVAFDGGSNGTAYTFDLL